MTYSEWEEQQQISPVNPEASYAEDAWNAALSEAKRYVSMAVEAEGESASTGQILAFILSSQEGLETN